MSVNSELPLDASAIPEVPAQDASQRGRPVLDMVLQRLIAAVRHPAFPFGALMAVGITLCFWPLFRQLADIWTRDEYYTHGFLVPFIVGYIIYRRWPKLSQIPVKPGWFALPPLLALVYVMRIGYVAQFWSVMSGCLILMLLLGVWFVAGWRWAFAMTLPALYLVFALPVWGSMIEVYTNPLQILSTKVAFALLNAFGFNPLQTNSTTIYLNNFQLDVGVPCSGLKLVLAVGAFTFFFMLIGNLKWWGNAIMVSMVFPLCLFINGLRIMLIGVVGDTWGGEAGHQFHDYSGYITLVICFFFLFKVARLVGWKD